jgi:hypothetical protein
MPVWWNWQTRRTQNPVGATPCGFNSHHRHHTKPRTYASPYFDSFALFRTIVTIAVLSFRATNKISLIDAISLLLLKVIYTLYICKVTIRHILGTWEFRSSRSSGSTVIPVEIKSGSKVTFSALRGLSSFIETYKDTEECRKN